MFVVPKSGSIMLRNRVGMTNEELIEDSEESLRSRTDGGLNLWGHLSYAHKYRLMLDGYLIVFNYRDPRDTIVSHYYWENKTGKDISWDTALYQSLEFMKRMSGWERFAHIYTRYELFANNGQPHSYTFRRGIIGSWRDELPPDIAARYDALKGDLQRWEWTCRLD